MEIGKRWVFYYYHLLIELEKQVTLITPSIDNHHTWGAWYP